MIARRCGVTLELLGAMALTGVVLWGSFDLFDRLDRLRVEHADRLAAARATEDALALLRDDLAAAAERAPDAAPADLALELDGAMLDLPHLGVRYAWDGGRLRRTAGGATRVLLPATSCRALLWGATGFVEPSSKTRFTSRVLPARIKLYLGSSSIEVDLR